MKTKIFRNLLLLTISGMIITLLFCGVLIYRSNTSQMEKDLRQDMIYVEQGYANDKDFFKKISQTQQDSRITLIAPTGAVLFDNRVDIYALDEHLHREEVQAALQHGIGGANRTSSTTGKQNFYYAKKLSDGNILRLAMGTDSVMQVVVSLVPFFIIALIIGSIIAYFVAKKLANDLVEPLEKINLDHPLTGDSYDELAPFLSRIDKQNKELLAISNMRREFTANVSHELKTPLQSISGYAEIIEEGIAKEEDIPRFVKKISGESKRLIYMVDNIIKLSKLDERGIKDEYKAMDLREVLVQVKNELMEFAQKKQVILELNCPQEVCIYQGIPMLIEECIYNLVENAIKYNKENGVVKIDLVAAKGSYVLEIKDSGIGIAAEDLERIFERFYRSEKSHSGVIEGSGLGLAIVKHGLELHDAKIIVNSKLNEGTLFKIEF